MEDSSDGFVHLRRRSRDGHIVHSEALFAAPAESADTKTYGRNSRVYDLASALCEYFNQGGTPTELGEVLMKLDTPENLFEGLHFAAKDMTGAGEDVYTFLPDDDENDRNALQWTVGSHVDYPVDAGEVNYAEAPLKSVEAVQVTAEDDGSDSAPPAS